MDLNDARVIMTVIGFVTFLGIIVWAYSDRQRDGFEKAARAAIEDDERNATKGGGK